MDTKIRMHFVVQLPEYRRAEMTVANVTRRWVEGNVLLFDDGMEHHVAFEAPPQAHRIVLIIDLWHPDVPQKHRR